MDNYYYFSTHTINVSIYSRLEAGYIYSIQPEETKKLLDKLVSLYPKGDLKESPLDYCSKFIINHEDELAELESDLSPTPLKLFFTQYLGYIFQWGASTRAFGKNSDKRAELITEKELIYEMTDPKSSIKKLLDSAKGNLSSVKPFLPAVMISLDTNTRNKDIMKFKHTGKFCFDFDKFDTALEAREWMDKLWKGTTNLKPYMGFISPRGKGFKIFFKVDILNTEFKRDFRLEEREVVMKHHKVWYEGARKEIVAKFPELEPKIDISTNDPQRLTYLPFINNVSKNFKYKNRFSEYTKIVDKQLDSQRKELLSKIALNSKEVTKIMKEKGISSQEDAYHLFVKDKSKDFDLDLETEKFIKVVDYLEDLSMKDTRVLNWVSEKFNDYLLLHKMSWVLYGVFGDLAIEQIKRLVPSDSNKLDETNNDYRWAVRSKNDYDDEQLKTLTPGAFYALVNQLGEVKDFISENFRISSQQVSDFKLINTYYETYIRNKNLEEDESDSANLSEFLDEITDYIDKKKIRLPLIEELDSLTSEVKLGPSDYLDKNTMEALFKVKYKDKRVFSLRSQCGTSCAVL